MNLNKINIYFKIATLSICGLTFFGCNYAKASTEQESFNQKSLCHLPDVRPEGEYTASVDQQIAEWEAIFDQYNQEGISSDVHIPELATKLTQAFFYVSTALSEEKKELADSFYNEAKELFDEGSMNLFTFNAINLRLSFLVDSNKPDNNPILTQVEGITSLYDHWHSLESNRTFLSKTQNHFVATVYLKKGGLKYERFINAFLSKDYPYGLAAFPLEVIDGPHGNMFNTPPLFYSHDMLHWRGFSLKRFQDVNTINMLPLYKECWDLKSQLEIRYQRILEVMLFKLLHEEISLYLYATVVYQSDFAKNISKLNPEIPQKKSNLLRILDGTLSSLSYENMKEQRHAAIEAFADSIESLEGVPSNIKVYHDTKDKINVLYSDEKGHRHSLAALNIEMQKNTQDQSIQRLLGEEEWILMNVSEPYFSHLATLVDTAIYQTGHSGQEIKDITTQVYSQLTVMKDQKRTVTITTEEFNYKINQYDNVTLLRYAYDKDFFGDIPTAERISVEMINKGFDTLCKDFFELVLAHLN